MSAVALAMFLRVGNGFNVQNYWHDQVVDGCQHYPFNGDGIVSSRGSAQDTYELTMPVSAESISLVENGLANGWTATVELYQFAPVAGGAPPSSKTLISKYAGEIIGGTVNETTVSIELGSSLDPVGSQIPPRVYTTTLVGEPPRY